MIVYVDANKRRGNKVARAFARGCGGEVCHGDELLSGPATFWGISPRTAPMLHRAIEERRDWVYLDHCYLGKRQFGYRATRNAFQHSGEGEGDPGRVAKWNVEIQPWRKPTRDGFVMICPPSLLYSELRHWQPSEMWLRRTLGILRAHTDRELFIRRKPRRPDFDDFAFALEGAHAVVTHISNTAIDALLLGIPAFVTGDCAARPMCETDLTKIETPRRPDDRERWVSVLAANQWTMEEMEAGICAKALGI